MANNENLKPIKSGELSKEELKKRQSNGGKKSGQVRRERANFKNILTSVFEGKPSKPLIEILKQAGIESPDKLNYLEAIIAFGALKTHSKKTGLNELTRFLEFARDSMGQKPTEKVDVDAKGINIVVASDEDKELLEGI